MNGGDGDDATGRAGDEDSETHFVYAGQHRQDIPRDVVRVRIDPSVEAIAEGAFTASTSMKYVDIPPSVKSINGRAFLNCYQLSEIVLHEGLERIGGRAFQGCRSLERLDVPSSVKVIDNNAFRNCELLAEVVLRKGLEKIGDCAFYNCKSLRRIDVPSSVKVIDNGAFYYCEHLAEVVMREGLERIGGDLFRECNSLRRIDIPSSVKVIDDSAFRNCDHLEEVVLREGLEKIGKYAFGKCKSLRHNDIPSSVKVVDDRGLERIEGGVFMKCKSLRRIDIPSSVKVIDNSAFCSCDHLEEVVLREGLERIGGDAFENCKSLRRIDIPSSVKEIDDSAFYKCEHLAEVLLREGLEKIKIGAFRNCKSLRCIDVPSSVKEIDNCEFDGCNNLAEVVLRDGLEKIGRLAFEDCISLVQLDVPASVNTIDKHAFHNCQQLMTVEFDDTIASLHDTAFQQCCSLRNITLLPETQPSLQFERCHDLFKLFGSSQDINSALKSRFVGLPIHKLCYYQSHYQIEETLAQLNSSTIAMRDHSGASQITSNRTDNMQDCLGMTPLHILACSSKQHVELYQTILAKYPSSLVIEDKWNCIPIFYAIWCSAPPEITQFLAHCHKLTFPNIRLDWDKMVETLGRAGASLATVQRLLKIRQASFPNDTINWQKAAREMTIRCVVIAGCTSHISSIWQEMLEFFSTSHQSDDELVQCLLEIRQTLFSDPTDEDWRNEDWRNEDWRNECEEFVHPLTGWWETGNQSGSIVSFRFLVKCNIPERLDLIGVRTLRADFDNLLAVHPQHFDLIHSKLVAFERLKVATSLLELALWKMKIGELELLRHTAEGRAQCRISSGGDIIIPNVIVYLIPNVVWRSQN